LIYQNIQSQINLKKLHQNLKVM